MYTVKFIDDKPMTVSLGIRGKPTNSTEVRHPDGTVLYLVESSSAKGAAELIALQSKFDATKSTAKYYQYGYLEYVLDSGDGDMFMLIMDDFETWHKKIKLG